MRRDVTRNAIADAAMTMLLEGGLDTVSVNQLAKRVGYTPGALYSYFSSRDAIIAELQRRIFLQFFDAYLELRNQVDEWIASNQVSNDVTVLLRILIRGEYSVIVARTFPQQYAFLSKMMSNPIQLVADAEAVAAKSAVMPIIQDVVALFETARTGHVLNCQSSTESALAYFSALQGVFQTEKLMRFFPENMRVEVLMRSTSIGLLKGWGAEHASMESAEKLLEPLTDNIKAQLNQDG